MARTAIPLVVLDADGTLIQGAAVRVFNRLDNSSAVLYTTEEGVTTATQPLSTDTQGRITAWTERGRYRIEVTPPGEVGATIFQNFDSASARDGSIVSAWIADEAITSTKIGPLAVTEGKIGPLAVTGGKIGPEAVSLGKLAPLSVDNTKLATDAVTTTKIQNLHVTADKIGNNAVTRDKILDGEITQAKLNASVVAPSVADNAITRTKILDGEVIASKLANDSVTRDKILNGEVIGVKIADGSITGGTAGAGVKLAAGTITNANVSSVIGERIVYSKLNLATSITNNDIAGNAVIDYSKLANLTSGQILVGQATNKPGAVSLGGDAQINTAGALTIQGNAITEGKLQSHATLDANRAVGEHHIKAGAVKASKIPLGVITGNAGGPGTGHIATETIGETDIANGAITSDKLAEDATIPPGNIGEDSIDHTHLADHLTLDNLRAVTRNHIRTDAIDEVRIANGAVTQLKLGPDSVGSDQLIDDANVDANRAVTRHHIRASAIDASKLDVNAVTRTKIQDGEVVATKIPDGVLTDIKLSGNISLSRLGTVNTGQIIAGNAGAAAVVSLGGDILSISTTGSVVIANNAINADKLKSSNTTDSDRAVTTHHIRNDAVTADKLQDDVSVDANRAVTENHLRNDSISTAKLKNDAVDALKLKVDTASGSPTAAVTANHIRDGAVGNVKLADNSVNAAKIQDGTVTGAEIASHASDNALRAIGETHIKDGAITNNKLFGSIGDDKITGPISPAKVGSLGTNQIFAGNAGVTTAVTLSGDISIGPTGAVAIGPSTITTGKIGPGQIVASHLSDGHTGTGSFARSISPTFTGTLSAGTIAATTFSGAPNFSGLPTLTTSPAASDNTKKIATTEFVLAAISSGGGSYQPINSNLSAISLLATTAYGRTFLDLVDGPAARTKIGAAPTSHVHTPSEITGFDTAVRENTLNQMAAPTAAVAMNNQKITGMGATVTGDPGTNAVTKAFALDRANHTGTQIAGTISNFHTAVQANSVNDLAAPTAAFNMNNFRITSLADPTAGSNAATKSYVDSVAGGGSASFGSFFIGGASYDDTSSMPVLMDRLYYTTIVIPGVATLHGIRYREDTTPVTGTVRVALFNSSGSRVAFSSSGGASRSSGFGSWNSVSFTSNYSASAGTYFIGIVASASSGDFMAGPDPLGGTDNTGSHSSITSNLTNVPASEPLGRDEGPVLTTY